MNDLIVFDENLIFRYMLLNVIQQIQHVILPVIFSQLKTYATILFCTTRNLNDPTTISSDCECPLRKKEDMWPLQTGIIAMHFGNDGQVIEIDDTVISGI